MGAEFEKRNSTADQGDKRNLDTENGGTVGSTDRNSSPENTRTGNTRTDSAGSGTGSGTASGKTEEKKFSGLASVTPESAPIPEAPKKKARRKQTQKKKKEVSSSPFDASQMSALLVSLSAVVASRPNLSMFALTEMEAQQIATPLSNMIAKSEKLSAVSEHSDAIALVSACLIIMLPRVIMYFDVVKKNKLEANGGVKIADKRNDKKTESAGDNRKAVGTSPAVIAPDVNGVSSAIPSII